MPRIKKDNFEFINININLHKELKKEINHFQIDYVFHYAALVGVERTIKNPLKVLEDVEGIKNILKLCLESKVKRIFFVCKANSHDGIENSKRGYF